MAALAPWPKAYQASSNRLIGIPRAFYYDKVTPPGEKEPRGGLEGAEAKVMAEAIAILKQQGAPLT